MKPNEQLIETIEKALNAEIPVHWHLSAPEWLRALLEERQELLMSRDGWKLLCEEAESQLQQTREELEIQKEISHSMHTMANRYLDEIEQVKAERDEWKASSNNALIVSLEWKEEAESLRTELSAKDKVLDFAKSVLHVAFEGGSLDGGDIQEMGVKYGLLEQTAYDPEKHEENWDFEPGDPYYTFTPILSHYEVKS